MVNLLNKISMLNEKQFNLLVNLLFSIDEIRNNFSKTVSDIEVIKELKSYLNWDILLNRLNTGDLKFDKDKFIEEFKDLIKWENFYPKNFEDVIKYKDKLTIKTINNIFQTCIEYKKTEENYDEKFKVMKELEDLVEWDKLYFSIDRNYENNDILLIIEKYKDKIDINKVVKGITLIDQNIINFILSNKELIDKKSISLLISDLFTYNFIINRFQNYSEVIDQLIDLLDFEYLFDITNKYYPIREFFSENINKYKKYIDWNRVTKYLTVTEINELLEKNTIKAKQLNWNDISSLTIENISDCNNYYNEGVYLYNLINKNLNLVDFKLMKGKLKNKFNEKSKIYKKLNKLVYSSENRSLLSIMFRL